LAGLVSSAHAARGAPALVAVAPMHATSAHVRSRLRERIAVQHSPVGPFFAVSRWVPGAFGGIL
jgi:hypothetical protein